MPSPLDRTENINTLNANPIGPLARETESGIDAEPSGSADALVLEELLVEDVSIDGMCGVY